MSVVHPLSATTIIVCISLTIVLIGFLVKAALWFWRGRFMTPAEIQQRQIEARMRELGL